MKTYYESNLGGSIKYLVNFHNGIKVHKDGSKFFDVRTFKNKAKKNAFIKQLVSLGYQAAK